MIEAEKQEEKHKQQQEIRVHQQMREHEEAQARKADVHMVTVIASGTAH
jgi:hypothetical protein